MTGRAIGALDRDRTVVLVTSSPLEVHGPHLPVVADIAESEGLIGRAMEKVVAAHEEMVVARLPPLFVATDVVPQAGSIRFSQDTVVRVLTELGTSLARQGFRHVWVGNFHGGPRHILAIDRAAHAVNRRAGGKMLSVFGVLLKDITGGSSDLAAVLGGVGGISREELKGDAHGGLVETALLLHLTGAHVDPGYRSLPPRSLEIQMREQGKPPLQKGDRATLAEIVKSFPLKQRYYETETYAGAPANASAELGAQYLEILSDRAAQVLGEVWRGERKLEDCHSPLWPMRHVLGSRRFGALFDRLFAKQPPPV